MLIYITIEYSRLFCPYYLAWGLLYIEQVGIEKSFNERVSMVGSGAKREAGSLPGHLTTVSLSGKDFQIGQTSKSLLDIAELKSTHTETEKVILKRRSIRMYRNRQVPAFMVKRILEAGRFAPSAGNGQPWKFIVLREPDIIEGLTKTTVAICKIFKTLIDYRIAGKRWLKPLANLFIRMKPGDLHPTPFGAVTMIADGKLSLYHGAPTVILLFKDVRGISNPDLDIGIAGQNMVLAAHSMGLGTCWVSFAKLAFQYGRKWRKTLGITYPYKFVSSLSIGWPVGSPDGEVSRPVHIVNWYENGITRQTE